MHAFSRRNNDTAHVGDGLNRQVRKRHVVPRNLQLKQALVDEFGSIPQRFVMNDDLSKWMCL